MDSLRNGMYKALLALDKVCDYVPVVGSITNGINAVIKKYIEKNPIGNRVGGPDPKEHYFNYIKSKENSRMALGAIPLVGNVILGVKDIASAAKKRNELFADNRAQSILSKQMETPKEKSVIMDEKKSLFNEVVLRGPEAPDNLHGPGIRQDSFLEKMYVIACRLDVDKKPEIIKGSLYIGVGSVEVAHRVVVSKLNQILTIDGNSEQRYKVLDLSKLDVDRKETLRSWLIERGTERRATIESEAVISNDLGSLSGNQNEEAAPRQEETIYVLKGGTAIILDEPKRLGE